MGTVTERERGTEMARVLESSEVQQSERRLGQEAGADRSRKTVGNKQKMGMPGNAKNAKKPEKIAKEFAFSAELLSFATLANFFELFAVYFFLWLTLFCSSKKRF